MPRTGQLSRVDEERQSIRREKVQELLLQGLTHRAIAAVVECSLATVSLDVSWIKRNWREKMAEQYDDMRAMELKKLDALEAALWPAAMAGKPHVVERVIAVMDHRAKMMGLYAPTTTRVPVITDDMLDALIAKKEAELLELTAGRTESIEAGETEEAPDGARGREVNSTV